MRRTLALVVAVVVALALIAPAGASASLSTNWTCNVVGPSLARQAYVELTAFYGVQEAPTFGPVFKAVTNYGHVVYCEYIVAGDHINADLLVHYDGTGCGANIYDGCPGLQVHYWYGPRYYQWPTPTVGYYLKF